MSLRIKIIENNSENSIRDCTLYYNQLQQFYHQFVKLEAMDFNILEDGNYTLIEINNPFHLRLRNLQLYVDENFDRDYGVYREEGEESIRIKAGRIFSMQFKDVSIVDTVINFRGNPISFGNFTVQIDNKDNRPLSIERINAEYFIDKIVFEDIGTGSYKLYFGNKAAVQPSYDIVNFKSYIEDEEQNEVSLGSLVILKPGEIETDDESHDYKLIFNILIIAVAVILVIFLAIILKKK